LLGNVALGAAISPKVGNSVAIRAKMILLCTGSKPIIPPTKGRGEITYTLSVYR
jgi:pyruvate/2-oxoglutarate dehydrogenase complex dihydrolipoamide dehydrogenase (E3) component